MMGFASTGAAYFALALALAALDLHPLTLFALPPGVAAAWTGRQRAGAAGLIGLAALAALFVTGSLVAAAAYAITAAAGLLLAFGYARGWSYTRSVWIITAGLFGFALSSMAAQWSVMRQASRAWMSSQLALLKEAEGAENAAAASLTEAMQWFSDRWDYLSLGLLFGGILVGACLMVSVSSWWLRRKGFTVDARAGGFASFRPSEWLVWLAILAAVLWMVERQWPNEWLRMAVWNGAVGLTFVYWLNGFSILVFAMAVMKAHPLLFAAVVMLVLALHVHSILCTFGLFDTWWDFRKKLVKAAEARRLRESQDDGEL